MTISSIISFVRWVCFHYNLNFPSSPFFSPRMKCSFPFSLSQTPRFCCKGASLCDCSVCVVKSSWWLRSLRNRQATVHILSSFLWILCEWCRYLKIIHILESQSILFGWDDADALTGWITFTDVFLRTCNRTSQPWPWYQQFLRCLFYRAEIVPERAWFFSLRMGGLYLWKDQAALNWGFKNQRYLTSLLDFFVAVMESRWKRTNARDVIPWEVPNS